MKLAALTVCIAATAFSAQAQNSWYGVPLPAGLGDPHRPILDVSKTTPPAAVVPPGEDGHRELAGLVIRKHLEAGERPRVASAAGLVVFTFT